MRRRTRARAAGAGAARRRRRGRRTRRRASPCRRAPARRAWRRARPATARAAPRARRRPAPRARVARRPRRRASAGRVAGAPRRRARRGRPAGRRPRRPCTARRCRRTRPGVGAAVDTRVDALRDRSADAQSRVRREHGGKRRRADAAAEPGTHGAWRAPAGRVGRRAMVHERGRPAPARAVRAPAASFIINCFCRVEPDGSWNSRKASNPTPSRRSGTRCGKRAGDFKPTYARRAPRRTASSCRRPTSPARCTWGTRSSTR